MKNSSSSTIIADATAAEVYEAFTTAKALEEWQAPETMTGKVHSFDLRVGGGYEMSLYYTSSQNSSQGKFKSNEDRFVTKFLQLVPEKKIVQTVNFKSEDPAFSGEMKMEITLEPLKESTRVKIDFDNIPPGIKPEDNKKGTDSSLQKLAMYLRSKSKSK